MSVNKYKVVKFNAVIPVKKEVTVKFRTKSGEIVSFPATKVVKKKVKLNLNLKNNEADLFRLKCYHTTCIKFP